MESTKTLLTDQSLREAIASLRGMTKVWFYCCCCLFILYAHLLEYDSTLYPLRLQASRLDGGAPPPATLHPH